MSSSIHMGKSSLLCSSRNSLKRYFAQQASSSSNHDRKVVLIEAKEDFYFAGAGAFADTFTADLEKMGIAAYQKSFEPNAIAFHNRAHHALALGKLKNGEVLTRMR